MDSGRGRQAMAAFRETAGSPNLRRAQLSFGAVWTGEWAVTVALGILAFDEGGAAAVGLVGMARMLPGALLAPLSSSVIDTRRRDRVLLVICLIRTAALAAAAVAVSELRSPVPAYALVAIATVVLTLYR